MEVARSVSGRDMESLALEKLGIEHARLKNLKDSRRDNIEMFTFDVLCLWRNKSVENSKKVMKNVKVPKSPVLVEERAFIFPCYFSLNIDTIHFHCRNC